MAWIEVTTEFYYQGSGKTVKTRHTINSDQIFRMYETDENKTVIYFAVAKAESVESLTVKERMADIVQEIKNREAALASSA